MPGIKARFDLKDADVVKLKNAISQLGTDAENVINEHMHNVTGKQMVEGITRFIPVSEKGTRHAKYSKWWKQTNYNLAVEIENSDAGKRKTSFYYLYYVATGTGSNRSYGKRDFMEQGINAEYDKIVDSLMEKLTDTIERRL